MRLTITIDMDNAAFDDEPQIEVARILRECSNFIKLSGIVEHKIPDSNGNTVGSVEVTA